jgi:hypothetical protein
MSKVTASVWADNSGEICYVSDVPSFVEYSDTIHWSAAYVEDVWWHGMCVLEPCDNCWITSCSASSMKLHLKMSV